MRVHGREREPSLGTVEGSDGVVTRPERVERRVRIEVTKKIFIKLC